MAGSLGLVTRLCSIDGPNHSLLAVVALVAEEPDGFGLGDLDGPRGELGRIVRDGDEAGCETDSVDGGILEPLAGLGKARLGDGVILGLEDVRDLVGATRIQRNQASGRKEKRTKSPTAASKTSG